MERWIKAWFVGIGWFAALSCGPHSLAAADNGVRYLLSYKGVLSAFVWKDIADATFMPPKSSSFNGQEGCQMRLSVSTKDYLFTENMRPTRWTYRSISAVDFSHSYLVEVLDKGHNHHINWLDWQQSKLHRFRKRQKVAAVNNPWRGHMADEWPQKLKWEEDADREIPNFLRAYPEVAQGLSYFIYAEDISSLETSEKVLDPLTLIYRLRYDPSLRHSKELLIASRDKIETMQLQHMATEKLEISGQQIDSDRLQLTGSKRNQQATLWLPRTPALPLLRMEVKAKIGTIRVSLRTLPDSQPNNCAKEP